MSLLTIPSSSAEAHSSRLVKRELEGDIEPREWSLETQSMRRLAAGTFLLCFVLGVSGCEPKPYDVTPNLTYDSTIGYDGTFDFYEPKSDTGRADRPAILAIHGGAWRGGDKAWGEQFAREFCPMLALRDDAAGPDDRVNVAVNLDGEHDMTMPPDKVMADFESILTDVMGHAAPWSDAELRDISTVTFARPDVAVLTVHGAGDDNVR